MKYLVPVTALALVCSAAFADDKKAHLTIISEKGFPHSAAFLEYPDGTSKWLGFVPKVHKAPIGEGKIDTSARDKDIDKYIRLEVDAKTLAEAEKKTCDKYADKKYEGTVRDCVSFTADLCDAA